MSETLLYLFQQLINGLTIGSTYALIAIGYTMVYGIIGMINFAHGEIYMIGSYVTFIVIAGLLGMGLVSLPVILVVALIVAVVVASTYGWTVERVAYRPLRGSNRLIPRSLRSVCRSSYKTTWFCLRVHAMLHCLLR